MASGDPEKYGNRGGAERSERRWTSWLIPMIVVGNVIFFIIVMYVNNCPAGFEDTCVARFLGRFSFQPLQQNPLLGPSSFALLKMGGLQWDRVVHQHQRWRLVTSMWLHGGLFHLLANMLCLVLIGVRLEQQFGFLRVGILYLLSGFGGSILSALFLQISISVGASGALFGLLGGMLSELMINWTIYANKASAIFTIIVIIAINLGLGLLPRIDNFAHIGGFISGFLLGFVLFVRPRLGWLERHQVPEHARVRTKYMAYQQLLVVVSLILLVAGFAVSLVMLFKGENGNDHCRWCHYLTCVPTSKWKCDI